MTFREQYEAALTVRSDSSSGSIPAAYFAGSFYEQQRDCVNRIPTIFCGGSIRIREALTLSYQPLDCHMLLYTPEGSGTLLIEGQRHMLDVGSLLYLDCGRGPFSLISAQHPWRYITFSLSGRALSVYESLAGFDTFLLAPIDSRSSIPRNVKQLLTGNGNAALTEKLRDAGLITTILTEFFSGALAPPSPEEGQQKYAPYLRELKHYIDNHLNCPLRLEDLERQCHVSKYRICHEFSSAFGLPPIKYLNKKRMETAENLLLSTEKKIHEIALETGFENTNHFIHLFKKEYGSTPQAYREAHQE